MPSAALVCFAAPHNPICADSVPFIAHPRFKSRTSAPVHIIHPPRSVQTMHIHCIRRPAAPFAVQRKTTAVTSSIAGAPTHSQHPRPPPASPHAPIPHLQCALGVSREWLLCVLEPAAAVLRARSAHHSDDPASALRRFLHHPALHSARELSTKSSIRVYSSSPCVLRQSGCDLR